MIYTFLNVASFVLLSAYLGTSPDTHTSNPTLDKLRSEAPAAWAEYEKGTRNLCGTYKVRAVVLSTNKAKGRGWDLEHEHYCNNRCRLLITKRPKSGTGPDVSYYYEASGYNPRYAFSLRASSKDGPWTPIGLQPFGSEESSMDGDLRHYLKESIPVLIRVRLFKLPDIFKSPHFQITRCFQKQENDENLVQLGFTFHDTVGEISVHMEGDCVLDPNKFWCIRSYSIKIHKKWPNSREETVQDQFQVNKLHLAKSGIPVPAMAVFPDKASARQ